MDSLSPIRPTGMARSCAPFFFTLAHDCDGYVCADGATALLQKLMMIVPEETDHVRRQNQDQQADNVDADIALPD